MISTANTNGICGKYQMWMICSFHLIDILMIDKRQFEERAEHYLVCYNEKCERSGHCLRHIAASYVAETVRVKECVNPTFAEVKAGRCPFFRPDSPMLMRRGFTHLYDEMPKRMGTAIRKELDALLGHNVYYKYRSGRLPIRPSVAERIADVCRSHGWTEPPVFDSEAVELDW